MPVPELRRQGSLLPAYNEMGPATNYQRIG